MKKGDTVYTPRFCSVQIEKVFRSKKTAFKAKFTEPTYYKDPDGLYDVYGKSLDVHHMQFAAVKK